jgi:hypothetical protein
MEARERESDESYRIALGMPSHVDVVDDSAYVVVPASMTFKALGRQVIPSGATQTVALRRGPQGWRIRAWAWSKGFHAGHARG